MSCCFHGNLPRQPGGRRSWAAAPAPTIPTRPPALACRGPQVENATPPPDFPSGDSTSHRERQLVLSLASASVGTTETQTGGGEIWSFWEGAGQALVLSAPPFKHPGSDPGNPPNLHLSLARVMCSVPPHPTPAHLNASRFRASKCEEGNPQKSNRKALPSSRKKES